MEPEEAVQLPPIDVGPPPPPQTISVDGIEPIKTISVDSGIKTAPPNPETASKMATKAQYGVGLKTGKGYDYYYNGFVLGQENELRTETAAAVDMDKRNKAQLKVIDMANKGFLTPISFMDTVAYSPSDPDTVFEKEFADRYVNTLYELGVKHRPSTWLDDARADAPEALDKAKEFTSEAIAKAQYALKRMKELEERIANKGWLGGAYDYLRELIPLYSASLIRGVAGGGELKPGLIGDFLSQSAQELYSLPMDQFKATLDSRIGALAADNIQSAYKYASRMAHLTERDSDNLFELLDLTGIVQAARPIAAVADAKMLKNIKDAHKSLVWTTPTVEELPPQVAAKAATGDAQEAAVLDETNKVTRIVSGQPFDPEQDMIDRLSLNFKTGADEIKAKAGPYQDLANRMAENYESGGNDLITALSNVGRPNRTPAATATEDSVRELGQALIDSGKYRGVDNQVVSVDLKHLPLTNSHYWEMRIGDENGQAFKSKDVAFTNIAQNHWHADESKKIVEVQKDIAQLEQEIAWVRAYEGRTSPEGQAFFHMPSSEYGPNLKPAPKMFQKPVSIAANEAKLKAKHAELEALVNKVSSSVVEEKGVGYYIVKYVPMSEVDPILRDRLITPSVHTSKEWRGLPVTDTSPPPINNSSWIPGWVKAAVGWIRSSPEVLPKALQVQREISVHGPTVFQDLVRDHAVPLNKLPRKYWSDFNDLVNSTEKQMNYETGRPGVLLGGPYDVHDWYRRNKGRDPHPSEIEAYFGYKFLKETQNALENLMLVRDKLRLGAQKHTFTIYNEKNEPIKSPSFDGTIVKPSEVSKNHERILIVDQTPGGLHEYPRLDRVSAKQWERITSEVEQGQGRLVKIINPSQRPLKGFGNVTSERIRYVYTKQLDSDFIDPIQRPNAIHITPETNYSIRQTILHEDTVTKRSGGKDTVHIIEGDRHLMNFGTKAEADAALVHFNEVNRILTEGKSQGRWAQSVGDARKYNDANLPIDWDIHYGLYKPGKTLDGKDTPPLFTLDNPMYVVPRGMKTTDMPNWHGYTKYGEDRIRDGREYLHLPHDPEHPTELFTMSLERGANGNPALKYEPSSTVSAITMMDRGLHRAINNLFLSDVKISQMEHWLQLAKKYFDPKLEHEWSSAPFVAFSQPERYWLKNMPFEEYTNLMSMRQKMQSFVGTPSKLENWLHKATVDTAEAISRGTGKDIVSWTQLPFVRNPAAFLKTVTQTAYMGLFSFKSLFTQMSQFGNIFMISPRHAPSATFATYLYSISRLNRNPEVWDMLDKKISTFATPDLGLKERFKPGHWTEATKELELNGFANVGAEHAYHNVTISDGYAAPKVIQNATNKYILEPGQIPFKLGAASTRVGAYYTAYLEWRGENPTAIFDRTAKETVLSRASLLDANMTRASNSMLQQGAGSIPFTFLSYELRMADQMMGKRLTPADKMRLLAGNFLLYGGPAATGLFLFPFPYLIKKYAEEKGYNVGDNPYASVAMEGGLSFLGALITGAGDTSKGNWYNFDKFANRGLDLLGFGLTDKNFLEAFGGAPYALVSHTLERSSWVWTYFYHALTDEKSFHITPAHFVDSMKEIATVKDVDRLMRAVHDHKWMTSNGTYVDNIGVKDAFFRTLFGLDTKRAEQAYGLMKIMGEQNDKWDKTIVPRALLEGRRSLEAGDNGDKVLREKYWSNMLMILRDARYPPERMSGFLSRLANDNKPLIDSIEQKWGTSFKDMPEGEEKSRMQRMQRTFEMRR